MLAFVGCLALLQLGSGAAVAEAWRSRHTAASAGSAVTQDIVRLDSLVRELRSVEVVVAMCAVISLMLWSFFAVVNVRLAARGRRSPLLAMAAWTLVPALIAVVTMLG